MKTTSRRRRRSAITVDLVIVVNDNSITEEDSFSFDPSLTPTITAISQNVSSVHGKLEIVIFFLNCNAIKLNELSVKSNSMENKTKTGHQWHLHVFYFVLTSFFPINNIKQGLQLNKMWRGMFCKQLYLENPVSQFQLISLGVSTLTNFEPKVVTPFKHILFSLQINDLFYMTESTNDQLYLFSSHLISPV